MKYLLKEHRNTHTGTQAKGWLVYVVSIETGRYHCILTKLPSLKLQERNPTYVPFVGNRSVKCKASTLTSALINSKKSGKPTPKSMSKKMRHQNKTFPKPRTIRK